MLNPMLRQLVGAGYALAGLLRHLRIWISVVLRVSLAILWGAGSASGWAATPVCSDTSLDRMYEQLQDGMTYGQVVSLFGASGYESSRSQGGAIGYAFLGKYSAHDDPAGSGRASLTASFPSTATNSAIQLKSGSYHTFLPSGAKIPVGAFDAIQGSSSLASIQSLLGASGTEIYRHFSGSLSYSRIWRFSDASINVSLLGSQLTFKSINWTSSSTSSLSSSLVYQINVGMTRSQVSSILGGAPTSSGVHYNAQTGVVSGSYSQWNDSGGWVTVDFDTYGLVSSKPAFNTRISSTTLTVPDIDAAYLAVNPGMTYAEAASALASITQLPATFSGSVQIASPGKGTVFLNFYGSDNTLASISRSYAIDCSSTVVVTVIPTVLAFTAPASLQSTGKTTLTAMVSYSDSTSKSVTPVWSSSDPAVATVSAAGVLAAGSITTDTPVTITATYTEAEKTVTVSKTITITAAPASLSSITISGGNTVASGGLLRLQATANYADGSSRSIIPTSWTSSLGTINSRGELAASTVTADTPLTVTASYSEGSISKTASFAITIKATPATLTSLGLVLPKGTLASGESMTLVAESGYSDGSGKRVSSVSWMLSDTTVASISSMGGVLTAKTVAQDTPLVITAKYSEGGQTLTARYSVIIQATAAPPQLTAEVIATLNAKNETKLQLWFNSEAGATVRSNRAGESFKVYVAALLPTGQLVSAPTFFLLNRSKEWQALAWPLAEYLSGVNAGDWQLIEVLDGVDLSGLSGAQILVGYGESDTEMLEAGRYEVAYQIP